MGLIEERLTPDFEKGNKKVWKYTPFRCVIKLGDKWYQGYHLGGARYVADMEIAEADAESYLEYPLAVDDADPNGQGTAGKASLFTAAENLKRSKNLGKF